MIAQNGSQTPSDVHFLLCQLALQSHNKAKALLPTYFLSNRLEVTYFHMQTMAITSESAYRKQIV